jgi:glycosyltransferase involved in cell wall biosynthesis
MKVALVYDRVNKWGGAERVLLALHEMFPSAPLYTAVYYPERAKWAKIFLKVIPSFLQKVPFIQSKHELLGTFMPVAFESLNFDNYDLVISVTSEAAKGIITHPPTQHICYCLTPTRYLWSGYDFYFQNKLLRFLAGPFISYLRAWDCVAAQRPDEIIAISTAVQKRIQRYYGRDSKTIFPPLQIKNFKSSKNSKLASGDAVKIKNYFLVVSRLVPYKRVDLVVAAFNELGLPLVIVGKGSQEKKLKSMAHSNIRFVGQLTDQQLGLYYRKSRALVFAQEEDFGLVAVEAQSLGIPVIAFKAGGALDIVEDGKTGIFFTRQTKESLKKAIARFDTISFKPEIIKANAQKFSQARFKKQIKELIRGKY